MKKILFCSYGHAVAIENAKAELVHYGLHGSLSFDRIAGSIQRRSESSHTHHAGENAQHTAANTALSGDTGCVHPVAGVLVEADRGDKGSYFRSEFGGEHLLLGYGIQIVFGYCRL